MDIKKKIPVFGLNFFWYERQSLSRCFLLFFGLDEYRKYRYDTNFGISWHHRCVAITSSVVMLLGEVSSLALLPKEKGALRTKRICVPTTIHSIFISTHFQ